MQETNDPHISSLPTFTYPPKYGLQGTADGSRAWARSLFSFALYLGLGYLLLRRWDLLLVISGVVLLHEMGHFIAMRLYNYADVSVFFVPVVGAFISGESKEISQRQSAVIFLAGPLPGILLGILLYFIDRQAGGIYLHTIPLQFMVQILIWINVLNLLPIYPLDGGQLLNRVFLNEEGPVSNIFLFVSAAVIIWATIQTRFYVLLIFPAMMVMRFLSARNYTKIEREITHTGVDLNTSYETLSDEAYWKIRSVLIKNIPAFQHILPGPPYIYDEKEEKISREVEAILQRSLIMDFSLSGKIMVVLIWTLGLLAPFLLRIGFSLLEYLRFSVHLK